MHKELIVWQVIYDSSVCLHLIILTWVIENSMKAVLLHCGESITMNQAVQLTTV